MNKNEKRICRTFSDDFKKDAVALVVDQGYSTKRAADAVGVSSSTIRDWMRKFGPTPVPCGDDATKEQLIEENRRLKKQLREAEMERAILKKATAYFAKESL
jgi:transposase